MDKSKAVKRINKFGKAGYIICIVLEVLVAVFFALMCILTFFVSYMPNDLISFSTKYVVEGKLAVDPENVDPAAEEEVLSTLTASMGSAGVYMLAGDSDIETNIEYHDGICEFTAETVAGEISPKSLVYAYIFLLLVLFLMFISFFFAGLLCKAFFKSESPFDDLVIKRMRMFAFSLVPWALFSYVESYLTAKILSTAKVNITINVTVIFTILVIFALTYIFKYGAVLQKESDETL